MKEYSVTFDILFNAADRAGANKKIETIWAHLRKLEKAGEISKSEPTESPVETGEEDEDEDDVF